MDEAAVAAAAAAARAASRLWAATANPDGTGLLERGREFTPTSPEVLYPHARVIEAVVRLARLAESVSELLRDCPDASVRRSAAMLAARAHPVRAALDAG